MRRKQIIYLWAVLGLLAICEKRSVLGASASEYTARAFIKVLPYADKDPMRIETPEIDKDIQYSFRQSIATLVRRQGTLQELIDRDKVRKTQWFRRFAKFDKQGRILNLDQCPLKAYQDLRKHFSAHTDKDSEFIVLSMTCSNALEAADIVNEMATLFVTSYGSTKKMEITARLTELLNRRVNIQRELSAAEKALADVRKASGFTDLEEHSYPHPITARLMRLEHERDNYALETKAVEAHIENLEKKQQGEANGQIKQELQEELNNVRNELVVLQSKLAELEKMREKAAARKKDLDLARIQYRQRADVRDERKKMLSEIKLLIEKLMIMCNDPQTPKVQRVGFALPPLEPDSPK
jgi:chromosome segregation ATPase